MKKFTDSDGDPKRNRQTLFLQAATSRGKFGRRLRVGIEVCKRYGCVLLYSYGRSFCTRGLKTPLVDPMSFKSIFLHICGSLFLSISRV